MHTWKRKELVSNKITIWQKITIQWTTKDFSLSIWSTQGFPLARGSFSGSEKSVRIRHSEREFECVPTPWMLQSLRADCAYSVVTRLTHLLCVCKNGRLSSLCFSLSLSFYLHAIYALVCKCLKTLRGPKLSR